MRQKLALMIAAAAGVVALLVPSSASADDPCVVVDAPPLHLQLGYAPNGPDGCTHLP